MQWENNTSGYYHYACTLLSVPHEEPAPVCLWNVYPIPAREQIFLHTEKKDYPALTIRLLDLAGREKICWSMAEGNTPLRLDIAGLAAGMYLLKITDVMHGQQTIRIIKH